MLEVFRVRGFALQGMGLGRGCKEIAGYTA